MISNGHWHTGGHFTGVEKGFTLNSFEVTLKMYNLFILAWLLHDSGHFISEVMNMEDYIKILEENMLPSLKPFRRRAKFLHNNDPNHSSQKIKVLKRQEVNMFNWFMNETQLSIWVK